MCFIWSSKKSNKHVERRQCFIILFPTIICSFVTILTLTLKLLRVLPAEFTFFHAFLPVVVDGIFLAFFLVIMIFFRQLGPNTCGRKRCLFSGTCSIDLKTLLQNNIDNGLPSIEDNENIKITLIPLLDEVKHYLENITKCSYSYAFSGSTEERFGIPYTELEKIPKVFESLCSDFDVMFCCEDYTASFSRSEGNVRIGATVGPSGLVYLTGTGQNELLDAAKQKKLLNKALESATSPSIPNCCTFSSTVDNKTSASLRIEKCLNLGISRRFSFEGDFTIRIKLCQWPRNCDWPKRRRLWPRNEDVQRIVNQGLHLVAKQGEDDDRKRIFAWRYSFSAAEVELSKLVPDSARKCFLALKVIFKDHLQPILPKVLTTYHIKTVFLRTMEKYPVEFWNEENIETCFQTLLEELQSVFDKGSCRHYWLPGFIDQFGGIETHFLMRTLAKKLREIRKNPAPYICDDGTFRCCCRGAQQESVSMSSSAHRRRSRLAENYETISQDNIQLV